MAGPLDGVTIIEATSTERSLGVTIAVAFCGRVAASLGARVLAVAPSTTVLPEPLAVFLSAGKTLAAADEDLVELVRRSGAQAVIADRALADALEGAGGRPAVVVAIADTSEAQGPDSQYTLMARSGVLDLIGDPDRAPLPLPGHQPAFAAGLSAYTGLAAALLRTRDGGELRERVDANILDGLLWLNWKGVLSAAWGLPAPTRRGALSDWPVLRCADGWVALVFRESDWGALKTLVDDPRLDEARFATAKDRRANRRQFYGIVEAALLRHTRAELTEAAVRLRLPLGPVFDPQELRDDPHYQARDVLEPAPTSGDPAAVMPRLPVRWNGAKFGGSSVETVA